MALPKLSHPTVSVYVPSLRKEVRIRPFTVREEKLLLMARSDESATLASVIDSISQLLTNCIIDDVEVDKLTLYDFEWLFIQLRAISVNDVIDFAIRDAHGKEIPLRVDLKSVKVNKEELNAQVELGGGITVSMSPVRIKDLVLLGDIENSDDVTALTKILSLTIVSIYDANEDKLYTKNDDFSDADLLEFVSDLTSGARDKLVQYFENSPKLEHTVEYTDSQGDAKSFKLKGLVDFFTLAPGTQTS